jgi:hypothetical protein
MYEWIVLRITALGVALAGFAGIGCLAWFVGMLLYEAAVWVKTDVWPGYTIEEVLLYLGIFPYPQTPYLGFNHIVYDILRWPGWLLPLASGVGCLWFAGSVASKYD